VKSAKLLKGAVSRRQGRGNRISCFTGDVRKVIGISRTGNAGTNPLEGGGKDLRTWKNQEKEKANCESSLRFVCAIAGKPRQYLR